MARACRLCKGRDGAHFGWCREVGGPGHKPSAAPVFQAPGQPPAAPPEPPTPVEPRPSRARRAPVPRDDVSSIAAGLAVHAALREARASVALDRDQTHVVGEPTPPPGMTRRQAAAPARPAPRTIAVCRGCGKSALERPEDWSCVVLAEAPDRPIYHCAECRADQQVTIPAGAVPIEELPEPEPEPEPAPPPFAAVPEPEPRVDPVPPPFAAVPPPVGRSPLRLVAEPVPPATFVPPVQTIAPGVFVYPNTEPRRSPVPFVWSDWHGEPDWAHLEVEATASQLLEACRDGLPEFVPFGYAPDVLALAGVKVEELEAALRHPQRVEIRPESLNKDKRYPILGFARGDVQVILGMRIPLKPKVIAAYWTSLLAGQDMPRSRVVTGGGGAKRAAGLPSTIPALVKRLVAEGCSLPEDWEHAAGPVEVVYRGQKLGKLVVTGERRKTEVQSDWQRFRRKVEAINLREAATG